MRKIDKKSFRMVIVGDSRGPNESWIEYRIVDGDLSEPGRHLDVDEIDVNSSVNELWSDVLGIVKEQEGV